MDACFSRRVLLVASLCLWFLNPPAIRGEETRLTDGNSTARFDLDLQYYGYSRVGNNSWTLNGDGSESLFQQWFWCREGDTGPELSLSALPRESLTLSAPNRLDAAFAGKSCDIDVTYLLIGTSAERPYSTMTTTVTMFNRSTAPVSFHLFHYADFDLNGSPSSEIGGFVDSLTVQQTENDWVINETASVPFAHYAVDSFPHQRELLNDSEPLVLTDVPGPIGPGDVTWLMEWQFDLLPNESAALVIRQDLGTPEPASLMLLIVGMSLFRLRRKL